MNQLVRLAASIIISTVVTSANAEVSTDVICTYAPSQSALVNHISSLAAGGAAGAEVMLLTSGMTIVPHASGMPILTGSAGYIAGSMTGAVVTTTFVTAGLIVGGTAVTVELACAPINHPEMVKKIMDGASEYSASAGNVIRKATIKSRSISNDKLNELAKLINRYKTITTDKFYELLGETWYEKALRKTKASLGLS